MVEYIDVEEAKRRTGLRLVLTKGVPGPWGEAAKAVLHVKRIPYVAVRQDGGGENRELVAWTGQSSAPVAVWNDEPVRTTSREILFLAERLAPEPALLPEDAAERALVQGLADEIHGEMGFGWSRRLAMLHSTLEHANLEEPAIAPLARMAAKYGYDGPTAARARARSMGIVRMLAKRLEAQRAAGSRFLVGDRLSAADLYWATFAALVDPLPHDLCPMPDYLRAMYTTQDEELRAAAGPLLVHRDAIYREFLELPMAF
jgi:glutathione S-transferase